MGILWGRPFVLDRFFYPVFCMPQLVMRIIFKAAVKTLNNLEHSLRLTQLHRATTLRALWQFPSLLYMWSWVPALDLVYTTKCLDLVPAVLDRGRVRTFGRTIWGDAKWHWVWWWPWRSAWNEQNRRRNAKDTNNLGNTANRRQILIESEPGRVDVK